MKKQGSGSLVYISSNLPERPAAKISAYAMSKAALNALALSAATEGGPYGITANIVTPGPIDTDMGGATAKTYASEPNLARDHFMIPMPVTAQAIGNTIAALCENSYVTGQNIFVDNGWQRKFIPPRKPKT